ncbi:MAG: universal stress protein, partial [Gemmatimonadota bacterium]
RTVLAAVDLHEGSERVVGAAARFARHLGARLVLCHVMTRTLQAYLRAVSSPAMMDETLLQLQNAARQEALELVPADVTADLEVRVVVTRGRPWTQILATAESESANLVVVGTGRSAAGRALLGGVTERVLRASNSSVLVMPT